MSKQAQKLLENAMQEFPKKNKKEIFIYALSICKQNKANTINYLIKILNDWVVDGVQTKDKQLLTTTKIMENSFQIM